MCVYFCVCTGTPTLVCSVGHSHEDIGTQTGTCVENDEYVVLLLLRATIDSGF